MINNVTITDTGLPLMVALEGDVSPGDLISWKKDNEDWLESRLLVNGAILLSNTGIETVEDFDLVIRNITGPPLNYKDGFSPRTRLSASTYTSTEYDAEFSITMHNELSYSAKWPSRLFFCCITPCESGGETTIADCRKILRGFRSGLLDELETKGVKYVRNLHAGIGAGPSWQQTYETDSATEVERFCRQHDIHFAWKPDGGIRLTQFRPAIITHPVTGEKVWFNQVDQFHPSHLDEDIYESLKLMYDSEEDMPMYGAFGDGSGISDEKIREIRETVDRHIVRNPWRKGDLLMVDNVLVCHGRSPYKGNRKIVVAMT
ncbi:MAG TPA: TauD/TfdA family dioxygenase [Puia sp.]|nr:TauD/TfdA family dioxygenase [Puia sp.]